MGASTDPTTVTKVPSNDPQHRHEHRGAPRNGVLRCGSVTARVRPWARSDRTAFLIVSERVTGDADGGDTSARLSPPEGVLNDWMSVLARWGYERVRTNAVGPVLAAWFSGAGFSVAQHLALLGAPLSVVGDTFPARDTTRDTDSPVRVRTYPGRLGAIAASRPTSIGRSMLEVDRECFPNEWAFDEQSLCDALRATPVSRVFHVSGEAGMSGFLIVGLAGRTAYIQRLAVRPEHRRAGVARSLMGAGLRWSRMRGCTRSIVNTEVDNVAALALYEGMGFTRMSHDLRVMEKSW